MSRFEPHRHRLCRLSFALGALGLVQGCYSVVPGRQAVDRVDINETEQVPESELKERIATAPSPKFFGLFQGVAFDYAYYDKYVLQRDLTRLERLYRARGFYQARVRAGRVIQTKAGHVRVQIVVDEGPFVVVEQVLPQGLETVPFSDQAAVLEAINQGPIRDSRFDEDQYEQTKERILKTLWNRGFAWAEVSGQVVINQVSRRALIQYKIDAGPRFVIRSVTLQGLGDKLPESEVRRSLDISPGQAFSVEELQLSKQVLLDLGVFSEVDIAWSAKPRGPVTQAQVPRDAQGRAAVDVLVRLTPAPLRTLRVGAGGELDILRTDVHGVAGWEDRNFLGGLRQFSVTFKPGLVLFPTTLPELHSPSRYLPEGRLLAQLRQPGLFESRTTGIIRGNASIFPVLLQPINEDVVLGYREVKGAVGIDRYFLNNHIFLSTLFHLQTYYPFTYIGPLDPNLTQVQIRYVELESDLIFRDNAVHPHKGVFLGNNLQLAGGALGGSISDVKVQPDLRLYVPISRTVTFAVRGSVGFLFPRNYGQSLEDTTLSDKAAETRDLQLLYFRALFSGGPGSNRGYPYRGVGPHGPASFLAPNLSAQQIQQECNRTSPLYDETKCLVPLGGLSLWEASVELRFPMIGDLSGALFTDASDVTRQRTTLHFEYLHLSTGGGLRYDTPVGAIRLDVGYRIPGLQKLGSSPDLTEGNPGTVFGAPIAFSLAVGEAF